MFLLIAEYNTSAFSQIKETDFNKPANNSEDWVLYKKTKMDKTGL
jgi:hypothetical protein